MEQLFENLRDDAQEWRTEGYPCSEYPLIGEILRYQFEGDTEERGALKYLREPQFQSLEVYWYLRLVRETPHIVALYKYYYGDDLSVFCDALGVRINSGMLPFIKNPDQIIETVKTDRDFVREYASDVVHEAVTLDYPSYIFALAMGSGKTVLIATIIATEFAMALRYPEGGFMKNALVFAPGTTIIESLREISEVPYEKILPSGLNQVFKANRKFAYPQDKAKDIAIQQGGTYNIIVTNTERISLRANLQRRKNQPLLEFEEKKEQDELEANLRLQKITSLPNLGIFSDEAHHTYGNEMDKELKRVRKTVNYINEETNLIAVINTTGTPYYKTQMLREVVAWYSIGEGIEDNILKSLKDGIVHYAMESRSEEYVIRDILRIFFEEYGDVALSDGAKAKIAFYFKTQEHLEASRLHIENALADPEINRDPTLILVNTQKTKKVHEIAEFRSLNDPNNQKRIILLINKGVEGWNCPSLFACALIKENKTTNNFVLQASTRCLRQTEGNTHPAKVFLDTKNRDVLDRNLQENFHTNISELRKQDTESQEVVLRICKTDLPKLKITYSVDRVVRAEKASTKIQLKLPTDVVEKLPIRSILTPDFTRKGTLSPLTDVGDSDEDTVEVLEGTTDCYRLARRIARNYHLPVMDVLKKLKHLYPEGEVPNGHLDPLCRQIDSQLQDYEVIKETVAEALALIHIYNDEGKPIFEEKDEDGLYIHRIRVQKSKLHLLRNQENVDDKHDVSFHYTPYNFDSNPELNFFEQILETLKISIKDVEIFLFTGGLTDPKKTDFHFEYKGADGNYHHYFPDFVIVKNTGEFFIVEIKSERDRSHPIVEEKAKAVEYLKGLQPDKHFDYNIIYTPDRYIPDNNEMKAIRSWIRNEDVSQTNSDENTLREENNENQSS